jgi:hypothetical protein
MMNDIQARVKIFREIFQWILITTEFAPCFTKTRSALDNMAINLKGLYDCLRVQVEEAYRASILKSERQVTR